MSFGSWRTKDSNNNSPRLRPMSEEDIELVLSWRNHPDIRRYMYTQHEIAIDEHLKWFTQEFNNRNRHLLIFEHDSISRGFVNIQLIASGGIANWGFYVAPDAPRGTGRVLGKSTLNYAFKAIALHKLCAQVLVYNQRSIRFHVGFNFRQEGILIENYFDGHKYHDVICFGLLANEWFADN